MFTGVISPISFKFGMWITCNLINIIPKSYIFIFIRFRDIVILKTFFFVLPWRHFAEPKSYLFFLARKIYLEKF